METGEDCFGNPGNPFFLRLFMTPEQLEAELTANVIENATQPLLDRISVLEVIIDLLGGDMADLRQTVGLVVGHTRARHKPSRFGHCL
jgi:hypothetical protein